MIIEINLTLVIQIIHFLVAYALLRVFLWKPIVDYLNSEDRHRTLLNSEIQKQKLILEQKEHDLIKIKNEAQQAFAQSIPHEEISTPFSRRGKSTITIPAPTIAQDQVDIIVQAIVQKVEE